MQNNGYVTLPVYSYDVWRNAVNGNGYDADNSFGDQCWDLTAEFWYNVGFPQGYPTLAGTHSAYGAWDDRVANAGDKFDLIYNKVDIKRGDVIVFNYFPGNAYGHIGFADEDYNGTNGIQILSQNNGGTPYGQGGTFTNINSYDLLHFRGAFRLKDWYIPPIVPRHGSFPWVLYANKLRNK